MAANLQACSFLLGRLQREVLRLRAIPFPGHDTGPRKWLNLVSGLLDTASGYLVRANVQGVDAAVAAKLVSDAEDLGNYAYKLLEFVAGADSSQIPHQVVAPFQRWVGKLGISQTIFFRAEHQPNYELGTIQLPFIALLNDASASLTAAHSAITWPVMRVSVPGHAMGLLPHFAVVAHELGHAIQDRIKPVLANHSQAVLDCQNRITARLAQDGITFSAEHSIIFGEILVSWLNELKADAVGHYLVGPAFFFALCGFLELSSHGYGVSPSHPPSDLRRALLFQRLAAGQPSFIEVFQQKTGSAITEDFSSPNISRCLPPDQMYVLLKQRHHPAKAAICVEFTSTIALMAQDVFDAAHVELNATCPDVVYSPEQLSFDLDSHLTPLCHLIPPMEFRDAQGVHASTLSSILNVGWAALLTRVDQFPAARGVAFPDSDASRMESLHELLLKAVELAEVRQLWEEQV